MRKKQFTQERYDFIKKLLTDNKVSSAELSDYINLKFLRHMRYQKQAEGQEVKTDEELLKEINNTDNEE
jgi:hypothetical protein